MSRSMYCESELRGSKSKTARHMQINHRLLNAHDGHRAVQNVHTKNFLIQKLTSLERALVAALVIACESQKKLARDVCAVVA